MFAYFGHISNLISDQLHSKNTLFERDHNKLLVRIIQFSKPIAHQIATAFVQIPSCASETIYDEQPIPPHGLKEG